MTSLSDIYQITQNEFKALIDQTDPFDPNSPVQLKQNVSDSTLAQIPFLNSAEYLLNLIAQQPNQRLKLTASGALPVKIVKALFEQSLYKDPAIMCGYRTLTREDSSDYIGMLNFILQQTPYVTCTNNALHLSPKAKKWLKAPDRVALLQALLYTFMNKYLLSSLDGYPESSLIQYSIIWTIYMLLIHKSTDIPTPYLTELLFISYPEELAVFDSDPSDPWQEPPLSSARHAQQTRVFLRCLDFFGWTLHTPEPFSHENKIPCVGASQLLHDCFELHQRQPISHDFLQALTNRIHH
jgi:hypothetical protein